VLVLLSESAHSPAQKYSTTIEVTNTPAYYVTELVTASKCFMTAASFSISLSVINAPAYYVKGSKSFSSFDLNVIIDRTL